MRSLMTCAAALLVAACGAEATPENDAAEQGTTLSAVPAANAATPARPQSWQGSYRAFFDGADGSIRIDPPSGSNPTYTISMNMANGGCSGEALGSGTAKGNTLSVIVPVGNAADGWQECRITLTRGSEGLLVREAPNCQELHGAACAFSGMAKKTGAKTGGGAAVPALTNNMEGIGAARSYMQEGGAVGCPNSGISGRARRVADRISANDECDTPSARQVGNAIGNGNQWLVGGWVDDLRGCQGDSGVFYNDDGSYWSNGASGRWSIEGNKLIHTLLETTDESDGSLRQISKPKPDVSTIIKYSASRMTTKWSDGSVVTLFKCPS